MSQYKIELTESECAAVYIALLEANTRMNERIRNIQKKIDQNLSFDATMALIRKRDSLEVMRKSLFATVEKFRKKQENF